MPPTPPTTPEWPIPTLSLRVDDLAHEGAVLFFKHIPSPVDAFKEAIRNVLRLLYTSIDQIPKVDSVLLVLRPMDGVAYTTGVDGKETAKEIHFSVQHILNSQKRCKDEIMGVLTHELVHCFQYNAKGTCPGGLIEGIADWVRLHADLAPPHWKKFPGQKWDSGYEKTGYFLDWVDHHYTLSNNNVSRGAGHLVRTLNLTMQDTTYTPSIWSNILGPKHTIGALWTTYCESFPSPPKPPKSNGWPIPFLNLRVDDLAHPGAVLFFENVSSPVNVMKEAVLSVFGLLYKDKEKVPENVASIQLILRSFPEGGVAYTTGSYAEKEIHFALEHIERAAKQGGKERCANEIMGVLTHEVVHCFQYNAGGTCPGGLVEGVADWVRLHASLAPPHWKHVPGEKWDAGYEKTGFFLDWVDRKYRRGSKGEGIIVRKLNETMKERDYDDEKIWVDAVGLSVETLWERYCREMKGVVDKTPQGKAHESRKSVDLDSKSDASLDAVVVFEASGESQ